MSTDPSGSMAGETLHATAVDFENTGILIVGASGNGKSSLALQLMAFGASLVSDDRTFVSLEAGKLVAQCPTSLSGLIEARGMGILQADVVTKTALSVVIDMDATETDRFPAICTKQILGEHLPCLRKIDATHFPAAIIQYVRGGRSDPQ